MPHESAQYEVLLGVDDVAATLGLSRASVYRLIEGRLIRFYRLRRYIRFRRSDVDAYLERSLVRPLNEYERKKNTPELVGRFPP